MPTLNRPASVFAALALILAAAAGCLRSSPEEVVVYAALDREFSEPILQDFEKATGVKALGKYDIESTKTVGLTTAIIQERDRPRCDVFWNNEILHSLRLARMGLLEAHVPPSAEQFPAMFRSQEGLWHGFAARARVLLVNTEALGDQAPPSSIFDLADPKWKGKCAIARPLFGTTATHAAVLFAAWSDPESGDRRAKEFFEKLHDNCEALSGNKQVALAVGRGQVVFGWTDTDDAVVEIASGSPVQIVLPDQGEEQMGALLIPNTLCLIKGGPNPEAARRLIDHLLTPEIEERLARGESAQLPLHGQAKSLPDWADSQAKWMEADFEAAAERWDEAAVFLRELFRE